MYKPILIPRDPLIRFHVQCKDKNEIQPPIIQRLSQLIRDSWRITEMRIVRLKSNKVELSNKINELALKLHLYKHILRDEHNKVRIKDEEIRWNNQRIKSHEYQLSEIKKELCTVNTAFVNAVVHCKKLHTESTNSESELRGLNDETDNLRCLLTDQRNSSSILSEILVDQVLEVWVLSACIKEELKGQIAGLEVKVQDLESRTLQLGHDADVQLSSLLGHCRKLCALRSEFDELNSHNRKFEKDNDLFQTIVKSGFEEKQKLQEIHDDLTNSLKNENKKTRVLQYVLEKTELQKNQILAELQLHQNRVECLKENRTFRKNISGINAMNILMFLLGYDNQFKRN